MDERSALLSAVTVQLLFATTAPHSFQDFAYKLDLLWKVDPLYCGNLVNMQFTLNSKNPLTSNALAMLCSTCRVCLHNYSPF